MIEAMPFALTAAPTEQHLQNGVGIHRLSDHKFVAGPTESHQFLMFEDDQSGGSTLLLVAARNAFCHRATRTLPAKSRVFKKDYRKLSPHSARLAGLCGARSWAW
jgi:hypothetical protein